MIVYGANPVLEAVRAHPRRVRYVAIAREHSGRMQKVVAETKEAGVALRILSVGEINRLAGKGNVHNGVIAEVDAGAYADFHDAVENDATKQLGLRRTGEYQRRPADRPAQRRYTGARLVATPLAG